MTKNELIELAIACGWKYRENTRELYKGRYYFNLNNLPLVILKRFDGNQFNTPIDNLHSAEYAPWTIGPFKQGWFSLKTNRFVNCPKYGRQWRAPEVKKQDQE